MHTVHALSCFAVVWYYLILNLNLNLILSISFRVTALVLGQYTSRNASEATLKNMVKYVVWIQRNNNVATTKQKSTKPRASADTVLTRIPHKWWHYNDVIMSTMASQITSLTVVHASFYSGAHQRKHQRSPSLAFVRGIHRWPANSAHKGPVTRKMFPFDDVIMI